MKSIASVFRPGHKALIPYVTVGYPNLQATLKVVPMLAELGCDIIELGIPYSDPMADGATIQKSSYLALKNGVTPQLCLEVAQQLRQETDVPLVFMTYLNPVFNYGYQEFCAACAGSGVNGLILPDLPPEEGSALETITQKIGLDLIYLLAPTSTDERVKLVAGKSRGFIYLVSVTGVTGVRDSLPEDLESFVNRVRGMARQPLCIGFGISTAPQAYRVACMADGVIVGSQIVRYMEAEDDFVALSDFVRKLRSAIDEACKV